MSYSPILNPLTAAVFPMSAVSSDTQAVDGFEMAVDTGSAVTINSPDTEVPDFLGTVFAVTDATGGAGTNAITIRFPSTGQADVTIAAAYESLVFVFDAVFDGWRPAIYDRSITALPIAFGDDQGDSGGGGGAPGGALNAVQTNGGAGFTGLTGVYGNADGTLNVGLSTDTFPTSGSMRFPYPAAMMIKAITVLDSGGVDRIVLGLGGGDQLQVGDSGRTLDATFYASTYTVNATTGAVDFGAGGFIFSSFATGLNNLVMGALNHVGVPTLGDVASTSPYAVDGYAIVPITGGVTLAAADYANKHVKFTGTLVSGATITLPAPADDAHSYSKWFWNATTQTLTFTTGAGNTKTILTLTGQWLLVTSTDGVRAMGAAIAP